MCSPLLNKNFLNRDSVFGTMANKKVRETVIAVNIEIKTPIPRVKANPFIAEVPSQKSMTAVMIEDMFESRIESHARENPS